MLSIHLGDYPGSIYDTETYFRNSYLDSWFEDPMAAQIIKSVDGSEIIGPHNIVSKQLGSITTLELSGGVKTLLLVLQSPKYGVNASTCGDNCAAGYSRSAKSNGCDGDLIPHHEIPLEEL